jgi:hypothetical protein
MMTRRDVVCLLALIPLMLVPLRAAADQVGKETPAGAIHADMECVVRSVYRHRPDGKPGREVVLAIKGPKLLDKATIGVECDGRTETIPVVDAKGSGRLSLLLPPGAGVKRECRAHITLRAGATVLERSVTVPAQRQWTVYVYPHSHVDIGYTDTQENVEKIHMRNLEYGAALAKQTAGYPQGARYKWNAEVTWASDGYLRRATAGQKAAFIEAVQRGWICLDATYANINTSAASDEELLRLFRHCRQLQVLSGVKVDTMVQMDVPGASWGVVQAARQNGVRYFMSYPNASDRIGLIRPAWECRPVWWVGPDGRSRILFLQAWPYAVGFMLKGCHFQPGLLAGKYDRIKTNDPSAHFVDTFLPEELAKLEQRKDYPYDIAVMSWALSDNAPIDADLPEAVKAWNEKYAYPRLVIAGSHEIGDAFEKRYGAVLPEVRGDFTEYWTDGLGSDARRVGLNRGAKERLVQAETLWAMLDTKRPAPLDAFNDAWRNVLLGTEHTWGYYDTASPRAKQIEAVKASYFENADKNSRELLALAVQSVAKPGSDTVAVLNTLSWDRGGLVELPADLSRAGDRVVDDRGREVPCQRLAGGSLAFLAGDVPPLGARLYRVAAGKPAARGGCKAEGRTLQNGLVKVALDPKTGDVASLVDLRNGREFVAAKSPWGVNSYRYLPGSDRSRASGPTAVVIKAGQCGPLLASLRVESQAAGCRKLTREISAISGQPWIAMTDTLDKIATRNKEGVHFAFAFDVPGATTRIDIPWGVMRPEADQLRGGNRNWLAVQRWVDLSNDRYGVTWSSPDAPLIEIGDLYANVLGAAENSPVWLRKLPSSATIFSWALNNHWYTNFPLEQGGRITFRYQILLHGGYDPVVANRFGLEQNRPLVVVPADRDPIGKPLLAIDNPRVAISTLKPSEDGAAVILRLRSVSDKAETVKLSWPAGPPKSFAPCLADERSSGNGSDTLILAPYGVAGVRIEF